MGFLETTVLVNGTSMDYNIMRIKNNDGFPDGNHLEMKNPEVSIMYIDPTFFQEETRCGYLVTEKTKKIWATELSILEKFDQVCKKHHLTYYAFYGTLLGAVRHQGFVPWDDDIDVAMFRDEYEKFQAIAPQEFSDPYFFQSAINDNLIFTFSKIRDSRTTAVEFNDPYSNQGIFIDIFPLDIAPDGTPILNNISNIQYAIWCTIIDPERVYECIQQGREFILSKDLLLDLLNMDMRKRFKLFESFNLDHFGQSELVIDLNYIITNSFYNPLKKEWFQKVEYLPFENMTIPVPAEYDKILTSTYGDYHQMIRGGSAHGNIILDPDIPYKDFMQKTDPAVLDEMLNRSPSNG